MDLIDKVSTNVTTAIDVIVEKNRQLAQLNRLAAIIRTEKAVLEHAYAALGRHYYKILDKTEEETDVKQICEVIRFSEARLKKAQARYDYIKVFGMPKSSIGDAGAIHSVGNNEKAAEETSAKEAEDENEDITIAVAEEAVSSPNAEEKAAKAVASLKKKRSRKKADPVDAEAADDSTEG